MKMSSHAKAKLDAQDKLILCIQICARSDALVANVVVVDLRGTCTKNACPHRSICRRHSGTAPSRWSRAGFVPIQLQPLARVRTFLRSSRLDLARKRRPWDLPIHGDIRCRSYKCLKNSPSSENPEVSPSAILRRASTTASITPSSPTSASHSSRSGVWPIRSSDATSGRYQHEQGSDAARFQSIILSIISGQTGPNKTDAVDEPRLKGQLRRTAPHVTDIGSRT
jgi:hypothetical protein